MKEVRLLTTDFFSYHFVEPVCAKLIQQDPSFKFSISDCSDVSGDTPDVDLYFLVYKHLFEDFIHEVVEEGRVCLWASPSYLERKGVPRSYKDLDSHTFIKSRRGLAAFKFGVQRFNTISYYAPYYDRKDYLMVDNISSMINLAEAGVGIIASSVLSVHKVGLRLERIPSLQEETEHCYRRYTIGYHKRFKDDPMVIATINELKNILLSK